MCRAREFTAAVQRLGQRRAWREALQVLESMESQALQANLIVHNAVLTALRRHWPCALQLFAALPARRLRPDGVSVNALMASDGLTKRRTLELLREMPRRLLSPDVVTFGAACSACEVETAWRDALHLLGEARGLKICSTILCSSVISACGKGKQWQIALDLLKSMEDLVFQRVQPNAISFNSAINACGRGSQWPLAVALLQRMARQSLRPTAAGFGAVVAATGRKGLWRMALLLMEKMEEQLHKEEGLEVNPWIRRGITWTCRKAKAGDFRMNLGTSQGTWADAANSGWEKALFQCWETLKDPLQRSSGSSAWYDLLPPNEVLKLLHLSGKAGLAENLWQQMAVVGMQGLIGWLVMMDVWQARCDRRCLLLATSGASQQLRSAWKSNNGDETWTTVEDSMDWAGQILQVNDMFYALEVNQRSVFGHLHGTFRSSLSSLAQLRKPRSDQSWGDAALQDTVLEQHFSLGLYFTPVALNELGLRYLDPDEKNWVLQCSRLFGRCFEFSVQGDKSDPNFNG